MPERVFIRTSDRSTFRRCRRKWNWSSGLRGNLEPLTIADPFWTGSAVHFALEDFHGHQVYGSPYMAIEGFIYAWKHTPGLQLPDGWQEECELARQLMEYYQNWLIGRDPLQTYWVDNVPQVEVKFEIPLPVEVDGIEVFYQGTFDRIMIDQDGRLWIVEYKTAKQFQLGHFLTDGQVSAYCWAATCCYDREVAGVIYQQHKKTLPKPPPILRNGKVSVNSQMSTTHRLYGDVLKNLYGSIEKAPSKNVEFLNNLAVNETEQGDNFLRRDFIFRNTHQMQAEGVKILLEAVDMMNPDLPLYPNPTRDCSWDCPFNSACVSMDDGGDWEYEIETGFKSRKESNESWRNHLPLLPQLQQHLQQEPPERLSLQDLEVELPSQHQSLQEV